MGNQFHHQKTKITLKRSHFQEKLNCRDFVMFKINPSPTFFSSASSTKKPNSTIGNRTATVDTQLQPQFVSVPPNYSKVLFGMHRTYIMRKNRTSTTRDLSNYSQKELNDALFKEAETGSLSSVKNLVAKGADVKYKDYYCGETPLHRAARGGNLAIVQWLAAQPGVDIKSMAGGRTPLHVAAGSGHLPIVQWLAAQPGVDINCKDPSDVIEKYPLHDAAASGNLAIVQWLVAQPGVDINCKDNEGATPLHYAVMNSNTQKTVQRYLKTVQWLVSQPEIDLTCRDKVDGKTALELAKMPEIIEAIKSGQRKKEISARSGSVAATAFRNRSESGQINNPFTGAAEKMAKDLGDAHLTDSSDDDFVSLDGSQDEKEVPKRGRARSVSPTGSIVRAVSPGKESQKIHRILMSDHSLMDYKGDLDTLLSYDTAVSVAEEIKQDIKQGRPTDEIMDVLEEQYLAARNKASRFTELQRRDVLLFWNRVAKLVFDGKPVRELNSNKPSGFNAIKGMEDLKARLDYRLVSRLDRFHPSQYVSEPITKEDFPAGVIFYGPPGAGKSFVARRLLEEMELNALEKGQKDVLSSFKGESVKNLSAVYDEAAQLAPSGLIFDEGESLMVDRGDPRADQHDKNLTDQMLQELENAPRRGIFSIFTTNHVDNIDPAVTTRRDRISRAYEFGSPDTENRRTLLKGFLEEQWQSKSHLKALPFPYTERDIEKLAKDSDHLSVDLIKNACIEAFTACRKGYPTLNQLRGEIEDARELYKLMKKGKRR